MCDTYNIMTQITSNSFYAKITFFPQPSPFHSMLRVDYHRIEEPI